MVKDDLFRAGLKAGMCQKNAIVAGIWGPMA